MSNKYSEDEFSETGELLLDPEIVAIIGEEKAIELYDPKRYRRAR